MPPCVTLPVTPTALNRAQLVGDCHGIFFAGVDFSLSKVAAATTSSPSPPGGRYVGATSEVIAHHDESANALPETASASDATHTSPT